MIVQLYNGDELLEEYKVNRYDLANLCSEHNPYFPSEDVEE